MAKCAESAIDFVFKEKSPEIAEIGDPFRKDLQRLNITVREVEVPEGEFIERERNGNYNIMFTKTWGSPYDPHTYFSSWAIKSHVEFSSTKGLKSPMTQEEVLKRIANVLVEQDTSKRDGMYKDILDGVHKQAAFLPLYGVRTPYVVNSRLVDFAPSAQTYSYPIANLRVASGPKTVSLAPGSGGSMFTSTGRIHPHLYAPNALFAQDWVYERLVKYDLGGKIEPSLAEDWTINKDGRGWKVVFNLRKGVKFHNNEPWNCAAAKLNFDHVLHPKIKDRHSWFKLVEIVTEWGCEGESFFIKTSEPYYPMLQELSYIRPLSFAAPGAFSNGINSDPVKENSCHKGEFGSGHEEIEKAITCKGLIKSIGTGPFKFMSKEKKTVDGAEVDSIVRFDRFDGYWGTVPEIEKVEVRHYDTPEAVKDDLVKGELDMALGTGPLSAAGIRELNATHRDKVKVFWSTVQQHAIAVLNTAKAPTDDLSFRKALLYGVDKAEDIITPEFADIRLPADQLLPKALPHCNVDLEPRFSYDLTEAKAECGMKSGSSSALSAGGIAGIVVAVLVLLLVLIFALLFRRRKKAPPASPLVHEEAGQGDVFS